MHRTRATVLCAPVEPFEPPPRFRALLAHTGEELRSSELDDLRRMGAVARPHVLQLRLRAQPHKPGFVVVSLVADPPVVPPVEGPDRRRHVAKGVWHRDPGASARLQDSRQLHDRRPVVVEVLEYGDRARRAEGRICERERLGGTDDKPSVPPDSLVGRELRRCQDAGNGQVTPDGVDATARRLDYGRARPTDADVEVRTPVVEHADSAEDAFDEAEAPVLEPVLAVLGELRVEVLALRPLLPAGGIEEDGDTFHERVRGLARLAP